MRPRHIWSHPSLDLSAKRRRIVSELNEIRILLATAFVGLALSACSQTTQTPDDPYAGLDSGILSWRTSLEATHPACATKVEGSGCEGFQVTCKAAQTITPTEKAGGVTAKVVAAMSFLGKNADGSTNRPGSATAIFAKSKGAWVRMEASPVNLTTCAPV